MCIRDRPIVVKNEIKTKKIISRNNKWAKERSKVISQYIMSEMLMNKKQATYLEQVLYEKYADLEVCTSEKNPSIISEEIMEKLFS